jgi:hydroxyquinol 1,2-dioxygenase
MRDIRVDTITQAVQQTWSGTPDARMKELLVNLIPHLHAYVRDMKVTHDEWLAGLDFLARAGAISSDKRNEFSLLSDVLGITSLVDLQNAAPGATIGSVLGPFYVENSPELPLGGDLAKTNQGDVILLNGIVTDVDGAPVRGASIDLWQADVAGNYAVYDTNQHPDNLRCKQLCNDQGQYWLTTVLPAPYSIPMDGPVGKLFTAVARSEWRPGHYHMIVRAPGYRSIVTEVFFAGGAYVDGDAVFGVREPLVVTVEPVTPETALPQPLVRKPDKFVRFDFKLVAAPAA